MKRSITHNTFVIEREYDATPARVFKAFADPQAKAMWFKPPAEVGDVEFEMDFRVGGRDVNKVRFGDGRMHAYLATYMDIVTDERIVSTYEMYLDDARISVSVSTLELHAANGGTKLILTEQGAYLDGLDTVESRQHGTNDLLDALGKSLANQA
jgi:uncharacterized protein YndB with AHSA1/START domain